MKMNRRRFVTAMGMAVGVAAAQTIAPRLLIHPWSAQWIALPNTSPNDYGVYFFRRTFELDEVPASFWIHVTADNRYRLFVNGEPACWGPARSDLTHWRYDTVDIAKYLRKSRNALAAVVWNDGRYAPVAQISSQTGFLLQGDTPAETVVNTGKGWYGLASRAYQAMPIPPEHKIGYYVAPPNEFVEGGVYPWGWERTDFEDGAWRGVAMLPGGAGAPRESSDAPNRWMLLPRAIPAMEEKPQRFQRVRQQSVSSVATDASPQEGVSKFSVPPKFPAAEAPFNVPGQSKARLLLDQGELTAAFPELVVTGGRGARITLRYAESLYVPPPEGKRASDRGNDKGNRDEVEGKIFLGPADVFAPDGGGRRLFRPLFWRTWRYVEMTIETAADPLSIEDVRSVYTGYPFQRKSHFEAAGQGARDIPAILDTGWHTARLCAHETYMDCPFYEQLQYVGDTRVQCLVSVYNTGDTRLMRNAIELIDSSRTAEGATFSRAPSALPQYIPGFSLWWIGMVHDYWMYADDPAFVARMLPGVRAVLEFFAAHQTASGSLGPMPWWNFVDWVDGWSGGVPPRDPSGSSAPQDLQLLMALNWAARMEAALGKKSLAEDYTAAADKLRATCRSLYWDARRSLFADTPRKAHFSQHTNALAVLGGVATAAEAQSLMERTLQAHDIAQASVYFRFYLHAAMTEAGLGDRYLEMLSPWKAMLGQGVTTWPEVFSNTSRSDCHAWGASPNIEMFRTVLGVDSSSAGFRRVIVRPHLGPLTRASGTIPHPRGEVRVSLELHDGKLSGEVVLPAGVEGEFRWRSITRPLGTGKTTI